ncbi:unnamed protein product [Plutella xylostella]|uniref:(diamondback moth) hypothetical protein n=1 Tax=Plutella xylostella TaxID=51655 RepID=A0A8S4EZN5_PLUXY|nr:unnamed protein product [Plutella xylostella]
MADARKKMSRHSYILNAVFLFISMIYVNLSVFNNGNIFCE